MKKILILFGIILCIGLNAQPGTPDANGVITAGPPDWVTGMPSGGGELQLQLQYLYNQIGGAFDTITVGGQKIYYDQDAKTTSRTTGVTGVVVQDGQELHTHVVNRTGYTLGNGTPVYVVGVDATTGLFSVDSAKASTLEKAMSFLGLLTADLPDDSTGLVTEYGMVRDFDTDHLATSPSCGGYLGENGGITSTKPLYPNYLVVIGATQIVNPASGRFHVNPFHITRERADKSYSFTTRGITAGTYWRGGFYDYSTAAANLTQASTTVTFGTANHPYAGHPFIVAGAAGTVDAGTIGLRVTGTSITDGGVRTGNDADTITTDITTLSTDDYLEAKKFIGTVTFELITTSGSPTTYALDINYGTAKYEDFGNVDFTTTGIEVVGLAGATDTNFDMSLLHHNAEGWTYSAASFEAGGTVIADLSDDMGPEDDLTNGQDFAWKRSNLDTFIDGTGSEGIIVKIVAGQNNSIQSMDIHITGRVESF